MKFIASQKNLVEALSIVSSVTTDRKSQLPILSNTLISVYDKNIIRFISTDSMIFSSVKIHADLSNINDKSICICAKDLLDRVRRMPTESDISIDSNGDIICIGSSVKHHIPVMNSDLFPQVQMPDKTDVSVNVPSMKIKELVNKTWFAVSGDHSQPNIHNSYVIFDGSNIQMVSFDGYKLAIAEQEFNDTYESLSVPYKAIMFIRKWISKIEKDKNISIVKNVHGIYFSVDNIIYGFRIMNATPPDYSRIFSLEYNNIILLDKDELVDSIMSNMLTDDRVMFSFDTVKNKCKISCKGDEGKYTEDSIGCKIKGNPPSFKINGKFLLDSINCFSTSKVRIKLGESKRDPVMVIEMGFKAVIAPMVD